MNTPLKTHTTSQSHFLAKLSWALSPLAWGGLTWFLAYGVGASIPISYPIRMLIGLVTLIAYFYKTCEISAQKNTVLFFSYPVSLPNWKLLYFSAYSLLIIYSIYTWFFSWDYSPVFNSIVFGVFASACLEELLARAFFIKYRMSGRAFIFFNVLSAIAFTLMHAGFEQTPPSLYTLFFERGHFTFSIMLGIIVYKTQRIEVTTMLHMASNFFRYTLPSLILHQECPIILLIFACVELFILGSMYGVKKKASH